MERTQREGGTGGLHQATEAEVPATHGQALMSVEPQSVTASAVPAQIEDTERLVATLRALGGVLTVLAALDRRTAPERVP